MNIWPSSVSTFLLAGLFGAGLALSPMSQADPSGAVDASNLGPELTMTQTNGSASLRAQPHVRAQMNQWPTRNRGAYNVAAAAGSR